VVGLIVDEGCDFAVVRSLRAVAFDVLAVSDIAPRATDEEVARLPVEGDRILITEDKDFGQLVQASGKGNVGVILVRFPARARKTVASEVLRVVRERGERLMGAFCVMQPGRVRIARRLSRT